jgi:hypothetical protein
VAVAWRTYQPSSRDGEGAGQRVALLHGATAASQGPESGQIFLRSGRRGGKRQSQRWPSKGSFATCHPSFLCDAIVGVGAASSDQCVAFAVFSTVENQSFHLILSEAAVFFERVCLSSSSTETRTRDTLGSGYTVGAHDTIRPLIRPLPKKKNRALRSN